MLKSTHERVHDAWCMCLLGSDANAPGANCSVGPSFIRIVPWPLMITMSSFAVCQCIGTLHPEASFNITQAGPKRGSPRTHAPVAQLGMSGIGSYFSSCGLTAVISVGGTADAG